MDASRFDRWTIALSRRDLAGALGLGAVAIADLAAAKNKHKHRHKHRKKVRRNAFGCVNVGGFCKTDDHCCSGICQGKKDKRTCQAHDQSTCQPGQQQPFCNPSQVTTLCTTSTSGDGICEMTTGKAPYCQDGIGCFPCRKDVDCVPLCGPQAACVRCSGCIGQAGTETACAGPSGCTFPPP